LAAVPAAAPRRGLVRGVGPLPARGRAHPGATDPPVPLLDRLLRKPGRADEIFASLPPERPGREARLAAAALEQLACWGGMPALLRLPSGERRTWLRAYDANCRKRRPEPP